MVTIDPSNPKAWPFRIQQPVVCRYYHGDELLYVEAARNVNTAYNHHKGQTWFNEADTLELTAHSDYEEAKLYESMYIDFFNPRDNERTAYYRSRELRDRYKDHPLYQQVYDRIFRPPEP